VGLWRWKHRESLPLILLCTQQIAPAKHAVVGQIHVMNHSISVLRSLRRVQNDLEWKGCMDTNDNRNYWSCCARKNTIFKIMQRKIVNAEWSNPRLINRFSYCTNLGLTLLCQAFQQLSVLLAMGPRKSVPIRQRESDIAHNPLGEISSSARATPLSARATKQPALVLLPGFLGNIAFSET